MPVSAALTSKVATFPAAQPDWSVADALNAPDATLPTKKVKVGTATIRGKLIVDNAWGGIRLGTLSSSTLSDPVKGLCHTTVDYMLGERMIDSDIPATFAAVKGMVDSLLGAGLITQATHDALLAFSDAPQSWSDINNNGVPVSARDVGIARGAKE